MMILLHHLKGLRVYQFLVLNVLLIEAATPVEGVVWI